MSPNALSALFYHLHLKPESTKKVDDWPLQQACHDVTVIDSMMRVPRSGRDPGFTMMEMVIVLAIIGTLAVILTPIVTNYVDQSRIAKAQSDARTIGEAISRFEKDVGRYPMWATSNALLQDSTANIVTLRSPGNLPTEAVTTAWTNGTQDGSDSASG